MSRPFNQLLANQSIAICTREQAQRDNLWYWFAVSGVFNAAWLFCWVR